MLEYILLLAGFFLLIKGANYLVDGASSIGKHLKLKPLIIGLTVLAFSTSLPELMINTISSIGGSSELGLGNIIGSNVANILIILGICAFFMTLKVKYIVVKKGIPFTLFSVLLLLALVNDSLFSNGPNLLSRIDGIIFLVFFLIFIGYIYVISKKDKAKILPEELKEKLSKRKTALMLMGGIVALFLGGELVVTSATEIALNLGLSEFLVSATLLAVGTSLPELVVSLIALFKKKLDFVVGNIIGSNIFNTFLVLGVSSIIKPIPFNPIYNFDLVFLLATTTILLTFMYAGKKQKLEKWNSFILIGMYLFYLIFLFARG
jgi:cation:H+ antiporter